MKTATNLEKITEAILPMKEVAEDQAVSILAERIRLTLRKLEEEFNGDRVAMSPYPNSLKLGRVDYMTALGKYTFLRQITTGTVGVRGPNDPDYAVADEEKITWALQKVRRLAGETFEAYACKLAKKVGTDVVSAAAVSDSNLWQSSKLTVYHTDGAFSVWNTNTIVNCSVYGKLFLQFPTRKAKK